MNKENKQAANYKHSKIFNLLTKGSVLNKSNRVLLPTTNVNLQQSEQSISQTVRVAVPKTMQMCQTNTFKPASRLESDASQIVMFDACEVLDF